MKKRGISISRFFGFQSSGSLSQRNDILILEESSGELPLVKGATVVVSIREDAMKKFTQTVA
jgi:hypothetical protein